MPLTVDLMSPVFGRFIDAVGIGGRTLPQLEPSPGDVCAAADLCLHMSRFFKSEGLRGEALLGVLRAYFAPFEVSDHAEYAVFSNPTLHGRSGEGCGDGEQRRRLTLKVALKNELADSYFQGQRFFQDHLEKEQSDLLRAGDVCPALLMQISGPSLRICALASETDLPNKRRQPRITCKPLMPTLDLLYNPRRPEALLAVARTLAATKAALGELDAHYCSRPAAIASAALRQIPYPLRAPPFSGAARLLSNRQLFHAVHEVWGPVAVKFWCAAPYGEDVHRLWADEGLAPKLHDVVMLPGSIRMLVMEQLGLSDGWAPLCNALPGLADAASARRAVREALRAALASRWPGRPACKPVHGDMRPGDRG